MSQRQEEGTMKDKMLSSEEIDLKGVNLALAFLEPKFEQDRLDVQALCKQAKLAKRFYEAVAAIEDDPRSGNFAVAIARLALKEHQ